MNAELINELTPYILGVVTILLGYLGNKLRRFIDLKVSVDKQELVDKIVRASVLFVEQIYGIDVDDITTGKFNLAKQRALVLLQNVGLHIDEEHLDTLIEAFVFELLNKDKDKSHESKIMKGAK